MVKIRMMRMGNNKRPFFRIVVADIKRKVNGRYLENVGWYDPKATGKNFEIDLARVDFWVSRGAQTTDAVATLIRKQRKMSPGPAAAESAGAAASA
ncbi:MAG: 30S ribosomal protein S16 [Kiritimatiellae bacterium]|nr:30S ribosomal protein S16 [Kiritimatiellia bacterium]MDW8458794.1 30S ribosomal protein S16 [Verrucomicrobiota bacterium]